MTSLFPACSRPRGVTLDASCWSCYIACARGRGPRQTSAPSRSTESSGSARRDGAAQFRSGRPVARPGPCRPILLPSRSGRRNTRSVLSIQVRGASEYGTDQHGQAAGALDYIRESRRMSGLPLPSAMRPDPARFHEPAPSCRLRAVRTARSFLPRVARGRSLGPADRCVGAMWTPVSTAGSTWRYGELQPVSPWLAG